MGEIYLKPLIPKKKPFKFAVLDIESNGWINFEMMGFYDGKVFIQFDCLASFLDHVLSRKYRNFTIYAHNGGKFDFLFLIEPLVNRNISFTTITQGARVTAIKISHKGRQYRFVDSYPILTASLAKLCETFAPERKKLSGVINFDTERVSRSNYRHQKYLEADCISLFQIINRYQSLPYVTEVGVKLTTAALAMAAFRTTMQKPIKVTSPGVQDFVRESYAGGRVEIFRQMDKDFSRYDVNSLFPAQMLTNDIPLENIGRSYDPSTFGFHDVTVKVEAIHIPILYKKLNGKLYFPTGIFRGVFFSEELKLACANGAKILKYHRGEAFSKNSDIFREFITRLYQMRLDNPGDNPINYLAKILMNSCYGKFAEREEKQTLNRVDPKDARTWPKEFEIFKNDRTFNKYGLINVASNHRPAHALVHIGAAITSYARIQMCRDYYLPAGDTLIYTDTDSVDTPKQFVCGTEIGQLKREYLIKDAFYLLPKAYYLRLAHPIIKNNKQCWEIKKIKGFNSKKLQNIDYEAFKSGKISMSENKIGTLKTSLIRNGTFLSLVNYSRSINSSYDKRVLLSDGSTRPWEMKNGVLR